MYIEMSKRSYTLRRRAESQEETRRRIVEATVHLHEQLGPRDTTISAIAERAGVQRLTVYRHFPDEMVLFQACTSHWSAQNPPPDPGSWSSYRGLERVREALSRLYGYYRGTARMLSASYRDEADVPALREPMARVRSYLQAVRDDLASHAQVATARTDAVRATLGGAVQFSTWQSLDAEGLSDREMADLVCGWLRGVSDI